MKVKLWKTREKKGAQSGGLSKAPERFLITHSLASSSTNTSTTPTGHRHYRLYLLLSCPLPTTALLSSIYSSTRLFSHFCSPSSAHFRTKTFMVQSVSQRTRPMRGEVKEDKEELQLPGEGQVDRPLQFN